MAKASTKTTNSAEFKLPQYLRLAKGSMWFDDISGIKLYSTVEKFVGRGRVNEKIEKGKLIPDVSQPDIPKDKFSNNNFTEYGWIQMPDDEFCWYVDTKEIPQEKQSRLILAYKHKILVEADPKNPPKEVDPRRFSKDFQISKKGDLVFVGKNKEIFQKLQNLSFEQLRSFVLTCPKTDTGKNNLIDMYHYEVRGFNRLYRARLEVLDMIRNKLKEFGPTMSAIRMNED